MLRIEIEYLTERNGQVKRYDGKAMTPGQAYWFGVYWRFLGDVPEEASLIKYCFSRADALSYADSLRELSSFRLAKILDNSMAWQR